jgi:excisionase family DNA binding protein
MIKADHLTVQQVADKLGVSVKNVQYWIRVGHLKALKISSKFYLVAARDLKEFKRPALGRPVEQPC